MARWKNKQIRFEMRKHPQSLLFINFVCSLMGLSSGLFFSGLSVASENASNVSDKIDYAKLYKKQCGACHGNTGNGKGRAGASFTSAPTDFTSDKSRASLSSKNIKKAIKDGVPGTAMVAYGRRFDDQTIDGLTHYIETAFMGRRKLSPEHSSALPAASAGEQLYIDHCSACHGDKGQTAVWAKNGLNPPPRNFTTPLAREELSYERMITSVTYGRPGTAMMSFEKRLSATQINSVVLYIRERFMKPQSAAATSSDTKMVHPPSHQTGHDRAQMPAAVPHEINVDMTLNFSNGLDGNAAKGKLFYEKNCFTCHGLKGNGKGPRAHFNYPRPRDFTNEESRTLFNRPRLFKSIENGKRGSVMPAWKTVLNAQEMADVAEYVFQQFIQNNGLNTEKKKSPSH